MARLQLVSFLSVSIIQLNLIMCSFRLSYVIQAALGRIGGMVKSKVNVPKIMYSIMGQLSGKLVCANSV